MDNSIDDCPRNPGISGLLDMADSDCAVDSDQAGDDQLRALCYKFTAG
jgi:hypothetical protein